MMLNEAADVFRKNPTDDTADEYQFIALEYWLNDMLSDETLLAVLKEIKRTMAPPQE